MPLNLPAVFLADPELLDAFDAPVADICDELKLAAGFTRNLAAALGPPVAPSAGPSKREKERAATVVHLEERVAKKDGVIAEISAEYVQLKKRRLGSSDGRRVPHDTRDEVVDFVRDRSDETELPIERFVGWLAIELRRHVLLSLLAPRPSESIHRPLGDPRSDDRGRCRVHP